MMRCHQLPIVVVAFLIAAAALASRAMAAGDASVFAAPGLPLTPVIRAGVPAPNGPLRQLTVHEHVGLARKNDLVRVPLFFHPGECKDPNGLIILDGPDPAHAAQIPYQADDIRKSDDGQIAAMHIYFFTDLAPWQRRQFFLFPGTNPAAAGRGHPGRRTRGSG